MRTAVPPESLKDESSFLFWTGPQQLEKLKVALHLPDEVPVFPSQIRVRRRIGVVVVVVLALGAVLAASAEAGPLAAPFRCRGVASRASDLYGLPLAHRSVGLVVGGLATLGFGTWLTMWSKHRGLSGISLGAGQSACFGGRKEERAEGVCAQNSPGKCKQAARWRWRVSQRGMGKGKAVPSTRNPLGLWGRGAAHLCAL